MTERTYAGWVSLSGYGEDDDALFLNYLDDTDPLAKRLMDDREDLGEYATVRYWVTDTEQTAEQAQEGFVRQLVGDVEAVYASHYSEITGYLWTDEDIMVGGHDLLAELATYTNRYVILQIDWSHQRPMTREEYLEEEAEARLEGPDRGTRWRTP